MHNSREEPNVFKGLVSGLAAGLIASWAMNNFQAAWTCIAANSNKPHGAQSMQPSEGSAGDQRHDVNANDDATVEAAKVVSEKIFGHRLEEDEKRPAGAMVHYAFGAAVGGFYGVLAESHPQVTSSAGLPFGAYFWLIADEIGVPLLALSKGPTAYPISTHVYALASHFVYGMTAEFSRRTVRKFL